MDGVSLRGTNFQTTKSAQRLSDVSAETVRRLVSTPLTGQTFADAVTDYLHKNPFNNYEAQDKNKKALAGLIQEKLLVRLPGSPISFATFEKGVNYTYTLRDSEQDGEKAVEITRTSGNSDYLSDKSETYSVKGVTLDELKEHCFTAEIFSQIQDEAFLGDATARYQLGYLYKSGTSGKQDNGYAFSFFQASAEEGHADAQMQCALMLERGIGCTQDQEQAKVYLNKAASQLNALAQCHLILAEMKESVIQFKASPDHQGQHVTFGHIRFKPHTDIYEKMTQQCATMNKLECIQAKFISRWLDLCGSEYTMRHDVNIIQFSESMRELADDGYAPAQYKTALIELDRYKSNIEKAFSYFEKAAQQGYAPAQYQCSLLLAKNVGYEQDSKNWLAQAASQKYPPALKQIAQVNNQDFIYFATHGKLFNGIEDGQTNLKSLPLEVAKLIVAYNSPHGYQEPPVRMWFDEMVELISWDNHGFKLD